MQLYKQSQKPDKVCGTWRLPAFMDALSTSQVLHSANIAGVGMSTPAQDLPDMR